MAFRMYRKPVPIALALRAAVVPNTTLPCLGIRFTPTPFTVTYLAEKKAALGLESAKCLEDKTIWNQYLYWQDDIHVRYHDSHVFPGYEQGTDDTKRCVLAVSNYSKPTPTTPHTIAAGFLHLSKVSKVSTLQTNRTSWKVDDFSILIDETFLSTTDETYVLADDDSDLAPGGRLAHRIGHIELSETLSGQEIAELETHPQGELAKTMVGRLEAFLNGRSTVFTQYQEGRQQKIMDAHSKWIQHMRGANTRAPLPNKSVKFEVSRRFIPTESSLASLPKNTGVPRLEGLKYIGSQIFKERIDDLRWHRMLGSGPMYDRYRTDDWAKKYSIYDMKTFNKDENHEPSSFGCNFEHMRGYRTNFDPSYEKTRTIRKIVSLFSDEHAVPENLLKLRHIYLDLKLETLREEWSAGDYIIAYDRTTTCWSEANNRNQYYWVFYSGHVGMCKMVDEDELETFKEREGENMHLFMEKHSWARGKVPSEAAERNVFVTKTEITHTQGSELNKEVTDQPTHSISPLSCLASGGYEYAPASRPSPSKHTVKFKVERQFLPTKDSIPYLRANKGRIPITGLQYVGGETLGETYGEVGYDDDDLDEENDHYSAQDHSARIAEGCYIIWEADEIYVKMLRHGTVINGGYEETHGEDRVLNYLSTEVGCPVRLRNLKKIVSMQTKREKWQAGDYTIIIDSTRTDGDPIREGQDANLHKTGSVTWSGDIEKGQEETTWWREDERMEHFMAKHHWALGLLMWESQTKVAKCIKAQQDEREV